MTTNWDQFPTHRRAVKNAAFRVRRAAQAVVIRAVWDREHAQCQVCKRPVQPPGQGASVAATGYVHDRSRLFTDAGRCRLLCGEHFNRAMSRRVIAAP